jgi:hypothetical protein
MEFIFLKYFHAFGIAEYTGAIINRAKFHGPGGNFISERVCLTGSFQKEFAEKAQLILFNMSFLSRNFTNKINEKYIPTCKQECWC